jgi:hypothetical protein
VVGSRLGAKSPGQQKVKLRRSPDYVVPYGEATRVSSSPDDGLQAVLSRERSYATKDAESLPVAKAYRAGAVMTPSLVILACHRATWRVWWWFYGRWYPLGQPGYDPTDIGVGQANGR